MASDAAESPAVANNASGLDDWNPSPVAPMVRNLSIAGIAAGDHDLGERSAWTLRRELGRPGSSIQGNTRQFGVLMIRISLARDTRVARATLITRITLGRQFVAMITKGFILRKDICLIRA